MPNIRLFVTQSLQPNSCLTLDPDQSHYLSKVMRCRQDDILSVFNPINGEWQAAITQLEKKTVSITLAHCTRPANDEQLRDVGLIYTPVKYASTAFIAAKATELGVTSIQPVITERAIVRKVQTDKLHHNAIEAAEQCERLSVPDVKEAVGLHALLADYPLHRCLLFCNEARDNAPLLDALHSINPKNQQGIDVLIGPEGGFSPAERQLLLSQDYVIPVSIGERVLKADTAMIVALALVQSA